MQRLYTIYLILIITMLFANCGGFTNPAKEKGKSQPVQSNENVIEQPTTSPNTQYNEDLRSNDNDMTEMSNAIDNQQPFYIYHNDNGNVWISHSQEEEDEYQMLKARDAQFEAMEEQLRQEEEEKRRNDFHNWEEEYVMHFYAEFSAYNEEEAEEIYYFHKNVDDRYFHEINLGHDAYEVEIEYKLESRFYKIKGCNVFLEFRVDPYLSRGDEGVLECSGERGTFYKKPY